MRSTSRWIGAVAGGFILVYATCAFAQDWPQWRGPNRDDVVKGFTAPATWPQELKQSWKVTVGAGDSTPALVGDKLYVFARQGDEEVILCLNAADGKEVWRDKYAAQAVTGPAARHPGPRSSPAVADGKIVALGATGILSCLDAASGKVAWRNEEYANAVPKFFTGMSPIIVDGMAIAHLGGPGNGPLVALDLATGAPKWKWEGAGPGYSSPALLTVEGAKQVVELTEGSVIGVGVADGKLLWQIPFEARGMAYNAATPIIDGQIVIYTGQGRGTHAVKIEKKGDVFEATPVWDNAELGTQFNTPVLKDGLLFGLSDKRNLFCLNAKTGQTGWTDTTRLSSFGAILDVGSVVLALPDTSELIVYKPDGQAYAEVA
ncbi:MAG: PQQ-like beta-propeller repeat protein, partial [Candidatus Sumerlaeota bacterium]|nr:PQQ-like beta-propeller repeat protein [Candidatus Sumerlaeota bacterium]